MKNPPLHHPLWMILLGVITCIPSAPCSEPQQAPNWKETTVYASAGGRNKEKGNLFRIRVLRSNPEFCYRLRNEELIEIPSRTGSLDLWELPSIPFSKNVQNILALENDRKAFEKYKSTTGWFDYSYTTPRHSLSFFFEDAGNVFLLQKNQGTKASSLKVKHNFQNFHIHKCSLDARHGLIPIAYSHKGGRFLGLVNEKTGRLKELGPWTPDGFDDCLKWLDDQHIVLTFTKRWSSGWAVYNRELKKIIAEGMTTLTLEPGNEYLEDFIVKEGQLFGLVRKRNDPPPRNSSLQILFPLPVQAPQITEQRRGE